MTGEVLRLATFRPVAPGAVVDARLRDAVQGVAAAPGLRRLYAGRRGSDPDMVRVLASVWRSGDDVERALQRLRVDDLALPEASAAVLPGEGATDDAERTVETLAIVLAVEGATDDEVTVLRVFHGRVRSGELDAYVAEAASGVQADIDGGHGPVGFFLGIAGSESFVTVSAWPSWSAIEQATGGNIHNPFATKFSNRLVEWTVDHYEVVAAMRPVPADASLVLG